MHLRNSSFKSACQRGQKRPSRKCRIDSNIQWARYEDKMGQSRDQRISSNQVGKSIKIIWNISLLNRVSSDVRNSPWYRCTSRPLPCAMDLLVKLPHMTIILGIKSFSMQLSSILWIPGNVCGLSNHTSERKKKCSSGSSSRTRISNCVCKWSTSAAKHSKKPRILASSSKDVAPFPRKSMWP